MTKFKVNVVLTPEYAKAVASWAAENGIAMSLSSVAQGGQRRLTVIAYSDGAYSFMKHVDEIVLEVYRKS